MFSQIDKTEKKVALIATMFAVGHLLLVAYAAMSLGISVPTCQPNEKLYNQSSVRAVGNNRFEIKYLAKMWQFEPKKITIPVGATIDFFLASTDVTHGFHIRDTDINLMAVPGVINRAVHKFTMPGIYKIVCHEYCGFGHENMSGEIEVSDKATEAVVTSESGTPPMNAETAITDIAKQGKQLYEQKGCVACHSIDGKPGVGPTLKGIMGATVELDNGSKVTIDEAYLEESIKNPAAKLVKGFTPVMPKLELSDQEVMALIEYIKTLK
ncbi:MAG: c-type cytochrome [Pseudobdellovibrionaceae bacterium]